MIVLAQGLHAHLGVHTAPQDWAPSGWIHCKYYIVKQFFRLVTSS